MTTPIDLDKKAQELQKREEALNLREENIRMKELELSAQDAELAKTQADLKEEKLMYHAMRDEQITQKNILIQLCQEIRDDYGLAK